MSDKPQTNPQRYRLYNEWEIGLRRELANWKDELEKLEAQQVNGQLVFSNARERLLRMLETEARETGLIPRAQIREMPPQPPGQEYSNRDSLDTGEWMTFIQLWEWGKKEPTKGTSIDPRSFRDPHGNEISVNSWIKLLEGTAEWLIKEGKLTSDSRPFIVGNATKRCLINTAPKHQGGQDMRKPIRLSNGLYLDSHHSAKQIGRLCRPLVEKFGQNPATGPRSSVQLTDGVPSPSAGGTDRPYRGRGLSLKTFCGCHRPRTLPGRRTASRSPSTE